MRVFIKKWGNSASVRIPMPVMKAAGLELDAAVDISEEDGRIVVTPARDSVFTLDSLLDGITAENLHSEADFGAPLGKEAF